MEGQGGELTLPGFVEAPSVRQRWENSRVSRTVMWAKCDRGELEVVRSDIPECYLRT